MAAARRWLLSLLTKHPQSPQESFDQEVADKGSGQDASKSSHLSPPRNFLAEFLIFATRGTGVS